MFRVRMYCDSYRVVTFNGEVIAILPKNRNLKNVLDRLGYLTAPKM